MTETKTEAFRSASVDSLVRVLNSMFAAHRIEAKVAADVLREYSMFVGEEPRPKYQLDARIQKYLYL